MAAENPLNVMPTMAHDLTRVESQLHLAATSADEYLTEITSHLISAGGKRVRPGFAIAAAATVEGVEPSATDGVVLGATSVELVHMGSLYHDDVMDDAITRRTVESVNAKWGNLKAILAGDFLLARASEIAASLGVEVASLLAATIAELCEGQTQELRFTYDTTRTEASYLLSIGGKTSTLLAAACKIGGLVAGAPDDQVEALRRFGFAYGIAFQITDDVLDIVSTSEELGKPAGHDLVEGVYTLPVIGALAGPDGEELRELLTDKMTDVDRDMAVEIVRKGGFLAEAVARARAYAAEATDAISGLPPTAGTTGLNAAAEHLADSVEAAAR